MGDTDCPNGGVLVETGIDENGNGVLDAAEVEDTPKVCNGKDGNDGAAGTSGPVGAPGLETLVVLGRVMWSPLPTMMPRRIAGVIPRISPATFPSITRRSTAMAMPGWLGPRMVGSGRVAIVISGAWSTCLGGQLAMDWAGNAAVVWNQVNGSGMDVWGQAGGGRHIVASRRPAQ